MPSPLARLRDAVRGAPASLALVALNVAVLAAASWRGDPTDPAVLVASGALERSRVWQGEIWRLLTAAALHVGWLHLAWNTLAGLPWCIPLERALGTARFLGLYAASALGASALSLLGQDVVSAGASGPLFGLVGGALALHRRNVGSWGAFLRSRPVRGIAAALAAWSALGLFLLPMDELAHAGGFAAGAAFAWLLSRPRPAARAPWLAYAGVLLALCAAAAWPRPGLTAFEARELERALHAALSREDVPAARALVERAARGGHDSDAMGYYRSLLRIQEGDLEGAAVLLRDLAARATEPYAAEARRTLAQAARLLGYRRYTGDGAPKDPYAGLAWFDEACAAGDAESCALARRIRDVPAP